MSCSCNGDQGTLRASCCSGATGEGTPTRRLDDVIGADVSRRRFLGACCATGFGIVASGSLASLLAGCGGDETSNAAGTLRVGHLPAGCIQHLLLASKNGLFAKEGLNVVLTQFDGPPPNLQSLVTGAIDVSHMPWTTVLNAYNENQKELRIFGGSGKGGIELVAREGSVKTVAELVDAAGSGLKVGTLRNDTLELVTYGTMKTAGVGYDDYDMKFFPSMVGMGEALIKKSSDVCSLAQPYGATVVDQAGGTYLIGSNQVWGPDAADCVISAKESFITKNKGKLETYLGVLNEAAKQRDADYDKAIDQLQPIYQVPRPILAAGLRRQTPQPILDDAGLKSLRNGVGYLIELGYLKRDVIPEVFDGSVQTGAQLTAA
jgi:NitT/TauT family transport system substrate-binding protein